MFEQAFKNIDDVLWKEAGCASELDYTEQTSWLLFLKYLDGLEQDKADEAKLDGKKYTYLLDKPYRWETWAAPKGKDGKLDHNSAQTGDDLRDFVNQKLFPYLHGFKQKATGSNTIEYKIGEIDLTGFFCTRLNVVFNLEEGVGRWQRRDLARSRWWGSCGRLSQSYRCYVEESSRSWACGFVSPFHWGRFFA